MKKMTMTEASVIVGGTCTTCVNSFELTLVGDETACNAVKTCTDKNGVVTKSYTPAAMANCGNAG
ncbi:DUF4762 family protein [Klebsiella grimontii]|uniref:DUF4762 family protein n=1 Tax=Klebsiella grimontii TaxID=2058152 RepID=UPI002243DDF0|nr:DUF4762 family protein [Klebsiella grimontii]